MASPVIDEKAGMPTVPLTVRTATHVSDHSSHDSDTLTPTAEKNGLSIDMVRTSEASTPSTRHCNNPFDTDIEAMVTSSSEQQFNSRKSLRCSKLATNDCEMWPGKDHWKRKAKAAKMKRSCNCLAHLSKRNRIIVKILIGLLIIGIAVGVGVGISKPLGAGIWHPKDS